MDHPRSTFLAPLFWHPDVSPRGSLHPLTRSVPLPALLDISPPPPRIIHLSFSVLVALFLVDSRITPSFFFIRFSSFFLLLFFLFLSLSLSLVHSTSLLFSLHLSHSRQREATSSSHGASACSGHLAYLSLRIARSSRAKGRISQRDDGGMREASRRWKDRAWKMARRESWRGKSSERVGEKNGAHDRNSGPQERASRRERDKLTRDGQRGPYSDIGCGMAKW